MELSIGFSPCPNDTFIFDALVNGKINTNGIIFKVFMEDVQMLNLWALQGKLDVSKISYGVLPNITDEYALLSSGGALGNGVGPLLISSTDGPIDFENSVVAIPGEHTTAHRLFNDAYPGVQQKVFIRYDEIEAYVSAGNGPGVIIHENRFTYQQKGLHKIADLGQLWESRYSFPIPLGGIVTRKTLPVTIQRAIDTMIRESLQVSFKNYPELSPFVTGHAQEMEERVMRQHIDLYVNDFTMSLGDTGKAAVQHFLSITPVPGKPPLQFV